ncbi:MAG: hypothetical protein U0136_13535 [Bdellovibrionota bacterium]
MPTLFNHSVAGSYPDSELAGIAGAPLYSTRILGCTTPNDVVQLPPEVRPEFDWIGGHYDAAGVPFTRNVVWDLELDRARRYADHDWSVFLYSRLHARARPDPRWLDASTRMNDKNRFIQLCWELGMPVPKTRCFNHKREASLRIGDIPLPIYRKTACSASGVGVVLCNDLEELVADLREMEDGIPFQLQEPVESPRAFINVQYGIQAGQPIRIGITDQMLNGYSHAGNRYPTEFPDGVWEICDPVATAIADMGLQGIFAFDVAIDGYGNPLLIECNPRWNAASYYWTVAQRLGAPHWFCTNQKVKVNRLRDLNLDGLAFDPATRRGLVIVLWGTVLKTKLGVLYAGHSHDDCLDLQQAFLQRNGASAH